MLLQDVDRPNTTPIGQDRKFGTENTTKLLAKIDTSWHSIVWGFEHIFIQAFPSVRQININVCHVIENQKLATGCGHLG